MMEKLIFDRLPPQLSDRFSKLSDIDVIDQLQDNFRRLTRRFDAPGPEMRIAELIEIEGIPCHYFVPFGPVPEVGPTLIYAHGGGFVTCDTKTHEGIIRRLANGSLCRVISVDYRLAPEFPFPAAVDDVKSVVDWALAGKGRDKGVDPHQLAIGGDSAGGNMAAWIAQAYRKEMRAQLLLYPLMQLIDIRPQNIGVQDWLQIGAVALSYIKDHYVVDSDPTDTRISPLLETNLHGLPPAYVLTCGLDPLREEGRLYADKLSTYGNSVTFHHEKSLPHGFLNFAKAFPKANTIPLDAAEFLRRQFPDLATLSKPVP